MWGTPAACETCKWHLLTLQFWQVLPGGPSNFCRQKLPQDFSLPLAIPSDLVSLVSLALCRWSNSVAMHWPFTSRHCPQSFQTFRKLGSWAGWCATWFSRLWMIRSTRSTTMWFLHMGHGVGCLVVAGRARTDSDYRRSVSAAYGIDFHSKRCDLRMMHICVCSKNRVLPNQQFIIYHVLFPCKIASLSEFQIPHFCTDRFECDVSWGLPDMGPQNTAVLRVPGLHFQDLNLSNWRCIALSKWILCTTHIYSPYVNYI